MAAPRLRLRLFPRAEAAVRAGHPWVYADSVKEQNRPAEAGEIAVMYDRHDRFLGFGLYDPGSVLRVRVLHTGKPATLNAGWWRTRLAETLARREGKFGPGTDGWRWISGESDGWPGLVLDRYAGTLVLKLYTAAWLPWLEQIEGFLREALAPDALVLRLSRNVIRLAETLGVHEGFRGRPGDDVVVFQENGLYFESAVRHGQKTGFFLDQRENRQRVGELCAGARVLNLCSFTGGFSVYAARGGAREVTDVDISAHALAGARRNFALNAAVPGVAGARHMTVQADAFAWLAGESPDGPQPGRYDVIISDPPSLARREAERTGAIAAYERLTRSALTRLEPGGILVAASCSAHVSADEFTQAVTRAATPGRGAPEILWTTGHAADHPATFPEAQYLKCLALRPTRGGK